MRDYSFDQSVMAVTDLSFDVMYSRATDRSDPRPSVRLGWTAGLKVGADPTREAAAAADVETDLGKIREKQRRDYQDSLKKRSYGSAEEAYAEILRQDAEHKRKRKER